jgi:hypothetical protein
MDSFEVPIAYYGAVDVLLDPRPGKKPGPVNDTPAYNKDVRAGIDGVWVFAPGMSPLMVLCQDDDPPAENAAKIMRAIPGATADPGKELEAINSAIKNSGLVLMFFTVYDITAVVSNSMPVILNYAQIVSITKRCSLRPLVWYSKALGAKEEKLETKRVLKI